MEDLEKRVEALEAELAKAKEEAAATAKAAEPYVPKPVRRYDPTEGFRLPPSAVREMIETVPDMRGIAKEQGRGRSQPGMLPAERGEPVKRGSGWMEPQKMGDVPGLRWIDQQIDTQDAIDKRELERKLRSK